MTLMIWKRLNPFTRWLIVAVSVLLLAVGLYFSQAMAQVQTRQANPPVTILPDRVIMPPEWQGSVDLTGYQVDTSVRDNVATTTVTQTYQNNSGRTLEARYLFPLPPDANFSSFTLTVNGKALEGKILPKDEARNTYQDIVRRLVDPGLLEYIDDKTVQVSVAPFFAGETKKIQLSYTQLLKQDGGLYKYTYFLGSAAPGSINRPGPMPRPLPMDDASHPHRRAPIAPVNCCVPGNVYIRACGDPCPPDEKSVSSGLTLNLDLKTAQALKTIYSPTHDPKIDRKGVNQASVKLSLKPADVRQEKNFVLYFSEDNSKLTLNALNYQKAGEDGYFLMSVRTPEAVKDQPVLPKDVVLVLDTSGSMGGEKIKQAKEALKYIINHLGANDRFGLLQFNTDVTTFKNELTPASADNKKAALEFVSNLDAGGSTNIEAALNTGFEELKNHDAKRPAYVIFLTDGEPTVGATDPESLVKTAGKANKYDARLFSFGVGYDLNALLLNKLSDSNHGSTTFVEPNENLETAMTGFYKKIEDPVLTDAKLDFGDLNVKKVYPEKLGDLFAGSEVIVLGRYSGAGHGAVRLSGKVGTENKSWSFPLNWTENTTHGQLPRLWAGRRIAYLLDNIRQNGENSELKDEIIALSKQYGIITPYTSFLSTEPEDYRRPMAGGMGGGIRDMSVPASTPMANRAAMDASSGQGAVQFSKKLKVMQTQASASALNAAQEGDVAEAKAAPTLKTVGNKTFLRTAQGVWTDTAYDEKVMGKPQQITFGTDAYFKLLSDKPELLQYFTLGEQVIVVLDGKAWQVLPAAKT